MKAFNAGGIVATSGETSGFMKFLLGKMHFEIRNKGDEEFESLK